MRTRGLVWLGATLLLVGCATTGNGGDVEGIEDDHAPASNANNPTKGPVGGGEGGSGQGAQGGMGGVGNQGGMGGGDGGMGGGGDDCATVCASKEAQCPDSGLNCPAFCDGATSNDILCLSGISCALISQCTGGGTGGMGGGGSGGMAGMGGVGGGGMGGVGGAGSCTYPNCSGCADTCQSCICAFQGDPTNCTSYCG